MAEDAGPGGGGGGYGWFGRFGDVTREDIEDVLLNSEVSDYVKPAGGGLLAWGALAQESLGALVATLGAGISNVIASVANANLLLVNSFVMFPTQLINAATTGQKIAITESFSSAEAALESAGVAAWLLMLLELLVLMYITARGIRYARSVLWGGSSG